MKPLEPTPEPKVRCSRLPLFFECPSSAQATSVRYDPSGDAAVLGTAAHAAMALVVLGQEVDLKAFINRPFKFHNGVLDVARLVYYYADLVRLMELGLKAARGLEVFLNLGDERRDPGDFYRRYEE